MSLKAAGEALGRSVPHQEIDVVFVDLLSASAVLDHAETRTPRLSVDDVARYHAMPSGGPERQLWRLARIATRIVLERHVGIAIRQANFELASGGRPRIGNAPPYFSVSHSGEAVLIAVSALGQMGVDLERSRRIPLSLDRRQRLINAARRLDSAHDHLLQQTDDADVLRAWVRLEAVAKADGGGIGRLLTREGVVGGKIEAFEPRGPSALTVRDLVVPVGYFAAVAAANLPAKIEAAAFPNDLAALTNFLGTAG